MAAQKMSVLLTTEGTYPFSQGGVSTWCDMLVKQLPMIQYTIIAILTDPFVTQKFTLARDTKLIRLPLWGTDDPSEHLEVRFSSTYLAKQRTVPPVIYDRFLPIFDEFVREILATRKNSHKMGNILVRLYDFFQEFDYKVAFKSPATWERYKQLVAEEVATPHSGLDEPDIYGLIQSLGWLYRFFNIVNTRVPETTVSHSSAAAFCGIPCVLAKLLYGTPFLLTEHGVYAREQYLSLSKRGYSSYLNTFLVRMITTVTDLNYYFADQISPVCEYNTRWEKRLTDRHQRIRVIYNGVDHTTFTKVEPRERPRPTVVTVARIDPIKDLFTLIRAAEKVKRRIPDVRFLIYGSVTVPTYHEECVELVSKLSLEGTVEFMGHTTDMASAYDSGDIVVQSSISEAFPYSVIEAMFAGKPVVSTSVGGIPEAIGDTGKLVNPGDDTALSEAMIGLLLDKNAQLELGQEARRRALDLFTLDRSLANYMRTYIRMAVIERRRPHQARPQTTERTATLLGTSTAKQRVPAVSRRAMTPSMRRKLAAERGFALLETGYPSAAVKQFKASIREEPDIRPSDVVKTAMVAKIYERLGHTEQAIEYQTQMKKLNELALTNWQQLLAERAYALADCGEFGEAVQWMHRAINTNPSSVGIPIMMMDMSHWLDNQGESQMSAEYRHKSLLMTELMSRPS